jgi:hypothetical protein
VHSQLYRALDRAHISQQQFSDLYELASHTKAKTGAFIRYLRTKK